MISGHGLGVEQAAQNAFLHALRHRTEERVDGVIVEDGHGQDGRVGVMRHPVGRGKGDHDLAAAVAAVGAGAGQAHQCPVAEPPQLALAERDVRSQHRDDGAFVLMGRDLRIQQRLDGRPRHDEVVENGMVREDERTDGVGLPVQLHLPGCRPDAAFQAVAAHPAPGSDGTFGKIGPAVGQRGKDMLFGHMQAPDVVQAAVVALADDRVHAAGGLANIRITLQHILHQCRLHGTHTEGIGEQDRRFQRPQLVDLDQAGRLAEAVDDMAGRQHLIVEHIARMRQQSRHAGLDIAVRQGAVPHRHARHIADLVPGAVRQSADPEAPFVRFDSHCSILL